MIAPAAAIQKPAFIGDDEFEYSRFGREELQAGELPRVSRRVERGVHVAFPTASGKIRMNAHHGEHVVRGHRLFMLIGDFGIPGPHPSPCRRASFCGRRLDAP